MVKNEQEKVVAPPGLGTRSDLRCIYAEVYNGLDQSKRKGRRTELRTCLLGSFCRLRFAMRNA